MEMRLLGKERSARQGSESALARTGIAPAAGKWRGDLSVARGNGPAGCAGPG